MGVFMGFESDCFFKVYLEIENCGNFYRKFLLWMKIFFINYKYIGFGNLLDY